MKTLRFALALAFLPLLFALGSRAAEPRGEPVAPVSVFVLRHAEALEATAEERDPGLAPAGLERAEALARLLEHAGPTRLYSSPLRRARATLAPLAKARELVIEDHPPQDADGLAAKLRALPPGSVAVVAGHSNTVPAIVKALGGAIERLEEHPRHGPMLAHDEHDRLFLVTLPATEGAAVKTIELCYGD
jgi:phosphohistidine phosphatase SixA